LDFTGKESVRFFQKILQKLPQSVRFRRLEGKDIYLYPYNVSAEKWNLVKTYPYQFLLYRKKVVKLPGGKVKNYHHYQLRYKLHLSAFSPVVLYPDNLISKGTPTVPHKPGSWREGCKELIGYIKEEFEMRKKRELLITLALKDGREITGVMKKYDGYRGMEFYLMDPSNKKNKIIVFKHAVEDFWVEE
jgi:sRNA-binding regulator protein Hfq